MTLRDVQTSFAAWTGRVKQWLDPPLTEGAEPLEIRQAVLDAIERHAIAAGSGQRVLAHNRIAVTVLAPTPDDRLALQAVLADLQSAAAARLREIRCQIPAGFTVAVGYTRRPRPDWPRDRRYAVQYGTREVAAAALERPHLRITVLRGRATQGVYTLSDPRVQIGRGAQPVDSAGRPRRNHIAFAEDGDEHGGSVGRAHASIRLEPSRGEFRVFDDGSRNGTRVVRDGRTFEVVRRDPTGVVLASGDEIHLGSAVIRVEMRQRT